MARIKGRACGLSVGAQMMDAVMSEAQHWLDVALQAADEGRADVESMALQRVAQLRDVAGLQAMGMN